MLYQLQDHFENIQSTNWRSMRWKPPSPAATDRSGPGWRVEFRPLEVQLTDHENAAFCVFVMLLSRCLSEGGGLNMYLPMSSVEENMRRAQGRGAAALQQKFWVNTCLQGCGTNYSVPSQQDIVPMELTLDEIFSGSPSYPGLMPMIREYIIRTQQDHLLPSLEPYLALLQMKAAGQIPTTAAWIREFVHNHPLYKGDGMVPPQVSDELLRLCDDIGMRRASLYGGRERMSPLDEVDEEDLMCADHRKFLRPITSDTNSFNLSSKYIPC